MNSRVSRGEELEGVTRALVFSLVVLLASGGDCVYSSVENRMLSDRERSLIAQITNQFLSRISSSEALDTEENEITVLDPVRFSDYFGYSVGVHSKVRSFEVLLDCDSECVTTYKEKANRNLLEQCGSPTEFHEGYINLAEANQAAHKFIEAQEEVGLIRQLAPERSALKCFGSEEYYQFVWRERYDEKDVAFGLVRVEVLVNPSNGAVYMYQFTKSEIDSEEIYDPSAGRSGALRSGFCGECSIEGMALFSLHHRDGSTRPAWAVRVTGQVNESRQSTVLFVDAETGMVVQSEQ